MTGSPSHQALHVTSHIRTHLVQDCQVIITPSAARHITQPHAPRTRLPGHHHTKRCTSHHTAARTSYKIARSSSNQALHVTSHSRTHLVQDCQVIITPSHATTAQICRRHNARLEAIATILINTASTTIALRRRRRRRLVCSECVHDVSRRTLHCWVPTILRQLYAATIGGNSMWHSSVCMWLVEHTANACKAVSCPDDALARQQALNDGRPPPPPQKQPGSCHQGMDDEHSLREDAAPSTKPHAACDGWTHVAAITLTIASS
jgi:hypothetical protein